jgi:hypothetical protein
MSAISCKGYIIYPKHTHDIEREPSVTELYFIDCNELFCFYNLRLSHTYEYYLLLLYSVGI